MGGHRCAALLLAAITVVGALCLPCAAENEPTVSAEAAILIEAETGEVLYAKEAEKTMAMASTTKIMTGYVAITQGDLTAEVCIPQAAVGVEGSSVYLYPGETLTLEALVYALMLESANDAAAAIACHMDGSVEKFADRMNRTAAELGLKNTHFTNPHGLYDEQHYTTALDLAMLTKAAMANEDFRAVVSTYKKTVPLRDGEGTRVLINHNKLLKRYEGCVGVKTGFTKKSGRCLVSAATRDGVTLIAVTLNAPDDWSDHERMLDYGFSRIMRLHLAEAGQFCYPVPVVGGKSGTAVAANSKALSLILPKTDGELSYTTELKQFYYAPIEAGQQLGQVIFYLDGKELARLPLTAKEAVEKAPEEGILRRLFGWLKGLF